jgi:hypothetical protein
MRFAVFPPRVARPIRGCLRNPRLSHDATHTLRRIPLVGSRTASPRPLPSCRYRSPRTLLRDRRASWDRGPSRLPCSFHDARAPPEHCALAPSLAGLAPPALAGPVHLPPQTEAWLGVPRYAEAPRDSFSSRRSDSFGMPSPSPPRRFRALADRPPVRRSGQDSWSSVPGGRSLSGRLSHPTRSHRGGCWPAVAHSVQRRRRWEHAPRAWGLR